MDVRTHVGADLNQTSIREIYDAIRRTQNTKWLEFTSQKVELIFWKETARKNEPRWWPKWRESREKATAGGERESGNGFAHWSQQGRAGTTTTTAAVELGSGRCSQPFSVSSPSTHNQTPASPSEHKAGSVDDDDDDDGEGGVQGLKFNRMSHRGKMDTLSSLFQLPLSPISCPANRGHTTPASSPTRRRRCTVTRNPLIISSFRRRGHSLLVHRHVFVDVLGVVGTRRMCWWHEWNGRNGINLGAHGIGA